MSDQNATSKELSDEDLDALPSPARARLRQLEKEVGELRPLKTENDRYKLKDSLRENKMDLDDDQLTALLAVHGQGEQTPEALRATAERLKFVEPIPATDAKDVEAQNAIDAARNGANESGGGTETYEEKVNKATSLQELEKLAAEQNGVLQRQG